MTDLRALMARWPGKSAPEGGSEHPAVLHMLDVAAVAERLIAPLPCPDPLKDALVLLCALHDLGKISDSFRRALREGSVQRFRHWEITEALLWQHDARLAERLGSRDTRRALLCAAAAGHHGRPSQKGKELNRSGTGPGGDWQAMLDAAGREAVEDAALVISAFADLWPKASLAPLASLGEAKRLTWQLNGLLTVADWVGSNAAWFPASPPVDDLAAYLEAARSRAAAALEKAGLIAPPPASGALFDFAPRPMQAACAGVPLPDGPMLALIEDETGSGKTEAALILARRMLAAGKGRGLYVALPTMATADAMFRRLRAVLPRFFDGAPTVTLAHGRAGLSEDYRDLALARERDQDEPGPTEWLRDSRRRALLATVGVGTVDQALLAAVKARHAPLRQYALSRNILIVDEVHEMGDPYMGVLLRQLLHIQAALGGSAILMSATLPLGLRAELVAAFEAGAGRTAPADPGPAYPSLTVPGVAAPAVMATPSPRGPVRVERLAAPAAAIDLLAEAAELGAAAVWVRNAVDEAIAAVEALRARGVVADLLHARFALADRKRHEAEALVAFGKDRAPRPGRVLVATQVVESSLDLDFDVMVSDLAPMAALVQRAGRLWRHMDRRPADTRPVPAPVLHVLSPDAGAVAGPDWAAAELGQGVHVYPQGALWRTARALFEAGEIRAPDGLRALIEAAHADDPLPSALEAAALRAEGRAGAERAHAAQNVVGWEDGYRIGASGAGDADYPTRLGQPQRVLVLMQPDGAPWAGGAWGVDSCQLSEVSASKARLDRLALPACDPPPGLPDWLTRTRDFVPVGQGGEICQGLAYLAESGLLFA
ncbi:CRISPR-associated helicase Cas3' [Tabrizicola sp. YIM 78059]|uniref:CRISPR-associated helicase Cas3' n=1 Tax=Tabrizicola sp. YIM 78059 TaxID=2529861 RepID=UPI0020C0EC4A|nr:CRISPR-associated helicase Cas3' [Tabrizicola sp. YIM 78059]